MTPQSPKRLVFNGVDGRTGGYLMPPMTVDQFIDGTFGTQKLTKEQILAAKLKNLSEEELADLNWKLALSATNYGVKEGVKAEKLEEAGWGIIFAADADPAIIEALKPLRDHRREQAAKVNEKLYREYIGPNAAGGGYRYDPPESKADFLKRQQAEASGPVNPEKMPYYLLIVGDPVTIPYSFQYQMDVQYAVGRIHFDHPAEYARYAESVVAAEKGKIAVPRRAAFFGPHNPDDDATDASSTRLIPPLFQKANEITAELADPWTVSCVAPGDSSRARLTELMGGAETPAFLFTASHGVSYDDPTLQRKYSGGLVCSEWGGPNSKRDLPVRDVFFAGEDVTDDRCVAGMIAMFFACFGAGTPQFNDFALQDGSSTRGQIAPKAFVSQLPRRLLSHPKGGALAVMGHVDRVWDASFLDYGTKQATTCFESALGILLKGNPIGMASEYFNSRYSEIGAALSQEYEDARWNPSKRPGDALRFTTLWTTNNDARNYVIVGDPAVRLVLGKEGERRVKMPPEIMNVVMDTTPTVVPEPQHEATPVVPAPLRAFGMKEDVLAGLNNAVSTIGAALEKAVQTVTWLTVTTYTSNQIAQGLQGAALRAQTKVSLLGDTESLIPENDGKVDDALWKIHTDALDRAIQNRAKMFEVLLSTLGLGNAGK